MEENNKFDNYLDFAYLHIASTRLIKQVILTISTSLISKTVTFYSVDILLSNNNFIIVCNYIYLLLLLN